MMADMIKLTDQNFEQEVVKSDVPVLVDFWAEWCGPCKMIAPIVEELADEYNGKLKVCKLDVDAHGSIAQQFRILSIPTVIIFKGGKVESQIVGAVPKKEFQKHIEKALSNGQ
jgi:thioredoxin 1